MYAIAYDVAKVLGYAIPSKSLNTRCKGVSKMELYSKGRAQQMLIISNGYIYRLITKSKLPQAE
jgi:prophage antirepressor-like protein